MAEKMKCGHQRGIAGYAMLLLSCCVASGQGSSDQTLYITQRFLNYTRSVPWEEIYVHTDRDEYIAGEDIWFNAYLIDRNSFNHSLNSRIIYFELLNPLNIPVVQKKVLLKEGLGQGHLTLPDSLVSGTYTIRAYTKWMQNFFPGNCFIRDINIYTSLPSEKFYKKVRMIEEPAGTDYNIIRSGLTMTADRKENGDVEILVDAPDDTLRNRNDQLYLFIQSRGNILYTGATRLTRGKSRITIPGKVFIPGFIQITLFDALSIPLCDRYIYIPPVEVLQSVILSTPGTGKIREKISLEFIFDDTLTNSINSGFSLSVTPNTGNAGYPDINEYLILGTEFGSYPVMALIGRRIEDLDPEGMQSLTSSLKSNWIDWKKILSFENARYKFWAESSKTSLYGKVLDRNFWPPLNNEILTMSFPGKTAQFQYAVTDDDGNFSFILPVDETERDLIIQTENISAGYKIRLRPEYSDYIPLTKMIIDSTAAEPPYISKWRLNSQVGRIYGGSYTGEDIKPDTSHFTYKRFYGKPDFTLEMDNYIRLPLMEEVFFELIPRVRMKKTDSDYEIIFLDPAGNIMFNEPPVLMIDGVIIKNPFLIGNMNPDLVEKIDIVWGTYVVDAFRFPGIVNVITRTADFSSGMLPASSLRMLFKISEPVATFVSPEYSMEEKRLSRIPDFRNTMYWNPSIRPGSDGKVKVEFWTSDYPTDYIVNVQGLTGEGNAVSFRKTIRIVSKTTR
jgi:hypothetical protein